MVEGLAVEHEAPVLRLESPKADAPLDRIDNFVADDELNGEIVKVGRVRRPGFSLRKGERSLKSVRLDMISKARDRCAPARERNLQSRLRARRAITRRSPTRCPS